MEKGLHSCNFQSELCNETELKKKQVNNAHVAQNEHREQCTMAWLICMFWSRSTFRVFSQCARLKFYISNGFFAITISILERERVVKAYNILHRSASAFSVKMFSQNTRRFFSDFLNTFCAISKRVYVLCVIVSFCFCMRAVLYVETRENVFLTFRHSFVLSNAEK